MRRAAVLLVALALTGCTGQDGPSVPAESAFAEGTCRVAAPDVRAVGRVLPRLGKGGAVPVEVRDVLRDAQQRLSALADGAEPAYKDALDGVVLNVGLVRIRADGNTYEPQLGEDLTTAYDKLLTACGAA